jgi:uncharacterized protein YodC (DUF2158 family)
MAEFKAGDIVHLKSGGPAMTIEDIGDYSMDESGTLSASCIWFENKKREQAVFAETQTKL